jgi:hypothetical protein
MCLFCCLLCNPVNHSLSCTCDGVRSIGGRNTTTAGRAVFCFVFRGTYDVTLEYCRIRLHLLLYPHMVSAASMRWLHLCCLAGTALSSSFSSSSVCNLLNPASGFGPPSNVQSWPLRRPLLPPSSQTTSGVPLTSPPGLPPPPPAPQMSRTPAL